MGTKNNSNLFYMCSLIEFISRKMKKRRWETVDSLGEERLERIYDYSDVLHCEPIEKVAAEYIEECIITEGRFDNESDCEYLVPDYWTIGEVYERLIEDAYPDEKDVKDIVCPDGCVMFRLTAKKLGNENFHKGKFWKEPEDTV